MDMVQKASDCCSFAVHIYGEVSEASYGQCELLNQWDHGKQGLVSATGQAANLRACDIHAFGPCCCCSADVHIDRVMPELT